MKNTIRAKWKKINPKNLIIFDRISITLSGTLLFLLWVMLLTKNFYPKTDDNLVAKFMNWPLQASIWPITFMILFIFVMPIWVTHKYQLLAIFLVLSVVFVIVSLVLLVFLNINVLWVVWFFANLIVLCNLIFVLFSIYYLSKKTCQKK